tara:strand:+ start:122 stop:229 length:108 start_codon:yes stop_codon:yes gene_type:complete
MRHPGAELKGCPIPQKLFDLDVPFMVFLTIYIHYF